MEGKVKFLFRVGIFSYRENKRKIVAIRSSRDRGMQSFYLIAGRIRIIRMLIRIDRNECERRACGFPIPFVVTKLVSYGKIGQSRTKTILLS